MLRLNAPNSTPVGELIALPHRLPNCISGPTSKRREGWGKGKGSGKGRLREEEGCPLQLYPVV